MNERKRDVTTILENNTLIWNVDESAVHTDNIEMSGFQCDYIVSYGLKGYGKLLLEELYLSLIDISGGCFDICINREKWTVVCGGITIASSKTDGRSKIIQNSDKKINQEK